jgi:type I restriction enzyme S subunit
MTLKTFFEKFDLFADAPGAVGKMRELVLELAVRGRLVEQAESDGNATSIFGKTRTETASRRFAVPDSWIWVRFADVGDQRLGKMLDQRGNRGDLKPYLRNTNVQWMRFELDDVKELRLEAEELDEYRLVPGDLLICEGGEPGRCAIWSDPTREMYFQKAIHRVRPRAGILASYLAICLRVDTKNGVLAKLFTGATIKHLTGRSLREYGIPLPPLAEQKRIVAKVDELMALCDRLEAQQLERETRHAALARASLARFADAPTPANLDFLFHKAYSIPPADLRKAILTLAVQGKLVPQDPGDEPAEESFPKPASLAVESDDGNFPAHWLCVPLGKLGEWRGGGTPSKSRPEFWKGELPWVSPKDMKVLYIADAQDHISPEAVEGSSVRLIPPGSLLMVVRGMILARAFPVALTVRAVTINQDMKALLPAEEKTKEYLLLALRAFEPDVLCAIEHSSHGTCKLKTELLQDIIIPIPPLAEQRRIVAKVDQLMALVDELETQLADSRATAAKLLSALVAELPQA